MVRTKWMSVITLTVALCMTGCQPAEQADQAMPTADEQKAGLLKQLEVKYENPAVHYQLGQLYQADGMLEKAVFEYQVAIGFAPAFYKAQAALVKTFKDKNDNNRSTLAAELYISQASVSAASSLELGKAFQKEGLGDYALACYQRAAELDPNSAVPYRQIGFQYLANGDAISAEENLRRSFELNPYQPDVAAELGRMGVVVQTPRMSAIPQGGQ